MLFTRVYRLFFQTEKYMAEITVVMRPVYMAQMLQYAVDKNTTMYAHLVRQSNLFSASKDLVDRVADYLNGRPGIDPGILRERVQVFAETYAATRPDQTKGVFAWIVASYPGTTEDEMRAYAGKLVHDANALRDHKVRKNDTDMFRIPASPEQAINEQLTRLLPYMKRLETMRAIMSEAAGKAGITLAAEPRPGSARPAGTAFNAGVMPQPA
jgi:hypothetical protein